MEYKKLISDYLSSNEISDFIPIDSGGDSKTFRFTHEGKRMILRVGGMRNNYDIEHGFLKILSEHDVKVPVPVATDVFSDGSHFSLQEELRGEDLYKQSPNIWEYAMQQVGREMRKAYAIKVQGFGLVSFDEYRTNGSLVGSVKTWEQAVRDYFDYRSNSLIQRINEDIKNRTWQVTDSLFGQIVEVVDRIPQAKKKLDEILPGKITQASIIHGDLHFDHILVNEGELTGIIDWNNTLVGDPLFDVAYLSIMPNGHLYKQFLNSSGVKMDEEVFNLYRLLLSIGKIHTRYVRKNYLEQYPEVVNIALEELNK